MPPVKVYERWYNWMPLLFIFFLMTNGISILVGSTMGYYRAPSEEAKARALIAANFQCPVYVQVGTTPLIQVLKPEDIGHE